MRDLMSFSIFRRPENGSNHEDTRDQEKSSAGLTDSGEAVPEHWPNGPWLPWGHVGQLGWGAQGYR